MTNAAAKTGMKYERTPVRPSKTKITDITQMNSFRIITHLYKKHEMALLYVALFVTYTLIVIHKIG